MKKRVYLIAVVLGTMAFVSNLMAASPTEATSPATDARARIISPLSIALTSGKLDFADLAVSSSDGTCIIDGTKTRTPNGGVTLGTTSLADVPIFTVSGQADVIYKITLPASITINGPVGSIAMSIDNLTAYQYNTTYTSNLLTAPKLSSSGTEQFTVGGTLNVKGGQMPGVYTNTFTVTVDYN